MLIQVVHCHPLVESYNHALFRTIVETLKQNGHRSSRPTSIAKVSRRR